MRGTVLALACLAVLLVAQGGQGDGTTVRLCGRDFVRAVVFTCGGSRWRRHLPAYPSLLESENPQPFPGDTDPSTYTDPSLGTDHEESHKVKAKPEQDLQHHPSEMSVLSKREAAKLLPTSCCTLGCSRREISSLC